MSWQVLYTVIKCYYSVKSNNILMPAIKYLCPLGYNVKLSGWSQQMVLFKESDLEAEDGY